MFNNCGVTVSSGTFSWSSEPLTMTSQKRRVHKFVRWKNMHLHRGFTKLTQTNVTILKWIKIVVNVISTSYRNDLRPLFYDGLSIELAKNFYIHSLNTISTVKSPYTNNSKTNHFYVRKIYRWQSVYDKFPVPKSPSSRNDIKKRQKLRWTRNVPWSLFWFANRVSITF